MLVDSLPPLIEVKADFIMFLVVRHVSDLDLQSTISNMDYVFFPIRILQASWLYRS